jgi:8-oxo-dGTP pyrophosphatase MutT (NUDIX family)
LPKPLFFFVNRTQLLESLASYITDDSTEQQFIARFITLLQHRDAFQRSHLPGHITGSAWISDDQGKHVLLTHHAKLNKWLQPGGHADGDENVIRVASREAEEETGLKEITLVNDQIFDIDIHTIPARGDMPEHLHYDIRYWFRADRQVPLIVTEESHALRWVTSAELESICHGNDSMMRMARKMDRLL